MENEVFWEKRKSLYSYLNHIIKLIDLESAYSNLQFDTKFMGVRGGSRKLFEKINFFF